MYWIENVGVVLYCIVLFYLHHLQGRAVGVAWRLEPPMLERRAEIETRLDEPPLPMPPSLERFRGFWFREERGV